MLKISAIVPVYNVEKYIQKCLESLINQTLQNIEIICVDDCSTDKSTSIIEQYMQLDKRIKLIKNNINSGASYTRNKGINHANGEYIGFIDGDDYISLNFFEDLYKKVNKTNSEVAKGTFEIVSTNFSTKSDLNEKIKKNLTYFFGEYTTAIYKTSFLRENNLYFPQDISTFEDPYFSVKTAKKIKNICFVDNSIYYYIRHEGSKSHNVSLEKMKDRIKCARIILNEAENEENYKILLNDLILYVFFITSFNLKDTEIKKFLTEETKKILLLHPEYNIERDYDKLYKKWYLFKMQTMMKKIRTKVI